jgi:Predicted metal-dependent enzyme
MAQPEISPPETEPEPPHPALRATLPGKRGGDMFFYGGQAVIEGVMMRGKSHYAVAVRLPITKEIVVDRGELKASIYVNPIWKLPFVRGLALIGEQLHLGMKSLIWAANMNAGGKDVVIGKKEITGSVAVAGVFALFLFIGLPLLLAGVAVHRSGSFLFVLVEGLIRVGLVLGYLAAIALLPDVRRVFQYHGAEHKTINAFESEWPLDVPSVRRASTLHPRCGTGFLLVVMVVGVIVFSIVAIFHPNWFWLITSRVLAIPLIAGAGFESIRFMARHRYHPVIRVLLLPVLGTQKFTTREPSDDMLEVAITAFNSAREGEEESAGAAA